MPTFVLLLASLAIFIVLVYSFSLWTAFGIVYMLGMLLVAVVAFFGRSRRQAGWDSESA